MDTLNKAIEDAQALSDKASQLLQAAIKAEGGDPEGLGLPPYPDYQSAAAWQMLKALTKAHNVAMQYMIQRDKKLRSTR